MSRGGLTSGEFGWLIGFAVGVLVGASITFLIVALYIGR